MHELIDTILVALIDWVNIIELNVTHNGQANNSNSFNKAQLFRNPARCSDV